MPQEVSLSEIDFSLLSKGGLDKLLQQTAWNRSRYHRFGGRILICVALTWGALFVLSAVQGTLLNRSLTVPFLHDFHTATRYLIMIPLLIGASVVIEPWVIQMTRHLRRLVSDEDLPRFQEFMTGAVRYRDSIIAEGVLILLVVAKNSFYPEDAMLGSIGSWEIIAVKGHMEPSLAWYWACHVARPLLGYLFLRWLWKYVIWSLLLCRVAGLRLNLIPTHPDRLGGLGFLASGQSKFAALSFIVAVGAASNAGMYIIYLGQQLKDFQFMIIGLIFLQLLIFITPLFAFTPQLVDCKRRGLFEYGALAAEYTSEFHDKWIKGNRRPEEPLLGSSDLQSLADLQNSFDVVQSMKSLIISRDIVLAFILASAIPFAPLLLTVYPFDELVHRLFKLFL